MNMPISPNDEIQHDSKENSTNKPPKGFWSTTTGKFIHGVLVAIIAAPFVAWIGIVVNDWASQSSQTKPDTKATKPKENTTSPRPEKITQAKPPLPETAKQRKIEEWRKEIQECTKNGYFNREQFIASKTYYEVAPHLSRSVKRDLVSPAYGLASGKSYLSSKIVLELMNELPNIAEQF